MHGITVKKKKNIIALKTKTVNIIFSTFKNIQHTPFYNLMKKCNATNMKDVLEQGHVMAPFEELDNLKQAQTYFSTWEAFLQPDSSREGDNSRPTGTGTTFRHGRWIHC